MPLHGSSGGQNCIIQHLVSSHPVGGRPVHRLRTASGITPVGGRPVYRLRTASGIITPVGGRPVHRLRRASGIITPVGGRPVHRLRADWLECMGL